MVSVWPNIPGTGSQIPVANYAAGITELYPNVNRVRLVETAINSRERIDFMPSNVGINQQINDKYIEFRVNGSVGSFLDLSTLTLELKLSFVKKGAKLDDQTNIAIANGISNTLIKSVNVFLNDKLVETTPFYNYVSYIKMVKTIKKEYLKSKGVCAFLQDDSVGGITNLYSARIFTDDTSEKRVMANLKLKGVETCFPLLLDICSLDMFLLDNINLRIRLEMATDQWVICSNDNNNGIDMTVDKAKLWIDRVIPNVNAMLALNDSLREKRLQCLFDKTLIKCHIIPQGNSNLVIEQPFNNVIPEKMTLCFIDNRNFSGDYRRNPLYFDNCNITNITISINGNIIYNLTSNFVGEYAMRSYYESIRTVDVEKGGLLDHESFINGRTIFTFNFTHEDSSEAIPIELNANMRISITLGTPLGDPHVLLLIGETMGILSVDESRNIQCDFRG